MPSKSLLKRGFKAEAERISEQYRQELGLSKFSALDAFALANHLEIPVFSVDKLFEGNENSPHYSILNDPDKFSAVWLPNEENEKIIIHNNKHSEKRQQSNIMHELAHIIRKHEIPAEAAKLCYLYNMHYVNDEHEEEAKHLGSCLQITRAGLLWALKQNFTELQISNHYNASMEMVKWRLYASGVIKQRNYQNARGY